MPKEMHIARVVKHKEDVLGKSNFSPNDLLKYTGQISGLQYMNDRCHRAHGLSIKEALVMKYTDGEGKQTSGADRTYGMPDLRYDLKSGRLEIVKTRKELGTVPPKPTGLPTSATAKRSKDTNDGAIDAPLVKRPRRVAVKKETKNDWSVTSSTSGAAVATGTKVDSAAWEIYDVIRTQAAKDIVSTRDIFTLVGIARNAGVEDLMLDVLPKLLSMAPKDRGNFGKQTFKLLDVAMKATRRK